MKIFTVSYLYPAPSLKILFFALFFSFSLKVSGQLEASKWVFGNYAGVDFKGNPPVAFTGSKLGTTEGCASISNKLGELLFYTDGITVWNRTHSVMPNGQQLFGDPSSTQSGVAVPLPGSATKYYLFTIDAEAGDHGFRYSIIDMSLNNGLGDVTIKNELIKSPCTEKITAVKHRNNQDIWILAHEYGSDAYLAYLLTKNGLSKSPIITKIGIRQAEDINNAIGYMKISPDGSQLAVAIKGLDCFQLFDFDNSTGTLSHPITFQLEKRSLAYGIEFSPNGSLLYFSAGATGKIYQVNLQAGSEEAIVKSLQLVGKSKDNRWFGALQVGIDGKIYASEHTSKFLSAIESPNTLGPDCGFKSDVIDLLGNSCTLGLPTFIQTYFVKEDLSRSKNKVKVFSPNEKVEVNQRFILNNILFDFNKSTLRTSSFPELLKVVNILKKNLTYKIEISGHTDNIGNKSYNIELSKARAEAVAKYLISKGIDKSRIVSVGKGSGDPIATNETDLGRQKNRRVEFMLKK